ncbi:hypothetical protein O181_022131 [Austropuccinia psidii MF-1]|uniref:Uncharacterized protein n=1 Tax=Austropuccinia psidii MF-1 TaxID=1389203 RepID=A0A9Q3CC94_9BASI|nr:hypothetical protein [Austropuccinia psidii MF-1]
MKENLPTIHQVQNHLILLKAFYKLKQIIQCKLIKSVSDSHCNQIFSKFLNHSISKFHCWLKSLEDFNQASLSLNELPTLDVLMVWHTYCLNPRWYCEDSLRLYPILQRISFPLELIVSNLKFDSNDNLIIEEEEIFPEHTLKELKNDSSFHTTNNNLKLEFSQLNLHLPVDPDNIFGLERLIQDIRQVLVFHHHFPSSQTNQALSNPSIAGTLTTLKLINNAENFQRFNTRLVNVLKSNAYLNQDDSCTSINDCPSLSLLQALTKTVLSSKGLSRILSAYESSLPFSIELASAVIRQSLFIEKISKLHYTEISIHDQEFLQKSVNRYYAFLELMKSDETKFFVPTLDIDLIWHTHQLTRGWRYCQDTINLVGRLVDHNDNVNDDQLDHSFHETSELWKRHFGVDYSSSCASVHHRSDPQNFAKEEINLLDEDDETTLTQPLKGISTGISNSKLGNSERPQGVEFILQEISSCGSCGASGCESCTRGMVSKNVGPFAGSKCGACHNGGCGAGGCGGGLFNKGNHSSVFSGCGSCSSGGCGAGGCGGSLVEKNLQSLQISACGGCGAGGCGGNLTHAFQPPAISGCGGCGAGGCGAGGCGGGN